MKRFFLILVMVFTIGAVDAIQPVRKPSILIKIDGKAFKNGEILTVSPGQKLMIGVELEGGRRDYCKFPETYADITGTAQILSRGENGLTYQIDGSKAEWNLLNEDISFIPDEFVKVDSQSKRSAEISISNTKFAQSFVKIIFKATWQFSQDGKTSQEENIAEEIIYFKVAGSSDVWFSSANIHASGIKNDLVHEKLNAVQAECDSIENNIYKLNFSAVQQSIRNLQNTVNVLKSTIDEVKASNPSYQVKVTFIGIPTDLPYQDIEKFSVIKNEWDLHSALVDSLSQELVNLPDQPVKENKDKLINIITDYYDWQNKLTPNTFPLLARYIPELNIENIKLPAKIRLIAEEKAVSDYSQILSEFHQYLDNRTVQISDELQKINSIHTRIQAVRIFDGMLRSYFSSINWAEWTSTRGY